MSEIQRVVQLSTIYSSLFLMSIILQFDYYIRESGYTINMGLRKQEWKKIKKTKDF